MYLVLAFWDGHVLKSDFRPVVIVITDEGSYSTENLSSLILVIT